METKGGYKLQTHKGVTTKSYDSFYPKFSKIVQVLNFYGSFVNLKPFYIARPIEKQTGMCLCSKCLNTHRLYKTIK